MVGVEQLQEGRDHSLDLSDFAFVETGSSKRIELVEEVDASDPGSFSANTSARALATFVEVLAEDDL